MSGGGARRLPGRPAALAGAALPRPARPHHDRRVGRRDQRGLPGLTPRRFSLVRREPRGPVEPHHRGRSLPRGQRVARPERPAHGFEAGLGRRDHRAPRAGRGGHETAEEASSSGCSTHAGTRSRASPRTSARHAPRDCDHRIELLDRSVDLLDAGLRHPAVGARAPQVDRHEAWASAT